MKKFQATIQFEMNDEFMSLIPAHRSYVNSLIEQGVIDQYAVSMESRQVWITLTAESKAAVRDYLSQSPLHPFWSCEIDELYVYDGQHYRLPHVQLN